MKIVLLLISILGSVNSVVAQQASEPFAISISTDDPVVTLLDPIHLKIELTNLSDYDIDCTGVASNGLDRAYNYAVQGPDGKPLETKKMAHPEIGETFSTWPCIVKPGKTASAAGGLISQVYSFNQIGQYIVVVSRKSKDSSRSSVFSNSLTIQVAN